MILLYSYYSYLLYSYYSYRNLVFLFSSDGRQPTISEMASGLGQTQYDILKVLSMQTYPTLLYSTIKSSKSKGDGNNKERTFDELIPSLYKAPIAQTGT